MELRLRKLPDDLHEILQAMAKRDGVSMRVAAIMLMRLGQTVDTITVQKRDTVRTKSGQSVQASEFQLPEWVPRDAWGHFEEMRRKQKKALTDAAKRTTLRSLEKLRAQGQDVGEVLEQSVQRCWTGVFPISEGGTGDGYKTTGQRRSERIDAVFDEVDAQAVRQDSPPGTGGRRG